MAEPESQTAANSTTEEQSLQQPSDAVRMSEVSKEEEEAQTQTKGDSSLPPPTEDDIQPEPPAESQTATATTGSTAQPSKGKGKDEPPVEDDLKIGPTDPLPDASEGTLDHPICNITLLLPNGARHPYKIDEKYLTKRNVDVPDVTETGKRDPFSISVYTLKELILREWREEWEGKPASPSSIRLIHFGKLLDDKEQLKSTSFLALHHAYLPFPNPSHPPFPTITDPGSSRVSL